jgi:hypothetical protein
LIEINYRKVDEKAADGRIAVKFRVMWSTPALAVAAYITGWKRENIATRQIP